MVPMAWGMSDRKSVSFCVGGPRNQSSVYNAVHVSYNLHKTRCV